jgi:hypothetical protein
MPTRKISSVKARSVAKALHRKAASRKMQGTTTKITRGATATGRGVVRFRASRVLDSLRTRASGHHSSKLRTSR